MDTLLAEALIQAGPVTGGEWSWICALWTWGFWIGVVVGIGGAIALFFRKSHEDA